MKKKLFAAALITFSLAGYSQNLIQENKEWRKVQNEEFRHEEHSPMEEKDRENFDSLAFFPIEEKFRVKAYLTLTPDSLPFKMKTSTDRLPDYRQWAIASFVIDGRTFNLPIYQSLRLLNKPGLEDYLFVPFTDLTNGTETYGGGRYIETHLPKGDTLIIDFNKAFNPYCAYSYRYSCPIPPKANHLDIEIKAGTKAEYFKKKTRSKRRKKRKSRE